MCFDDFDNTSNESVGLRENACAEPLMIGSETLRLRVAPVRPPQLTYELSPSKEEGAFTFLYTLRTPGDHDIPGHGIVLVSERCNIVAI
jgi:hypothetical protein